MGSMEESRTLMLNLTLVHKEFQHQIFNISLLEWTKVFEEVRPMGHL